MGIFSKDKPKPPARMNEKPAPATTPARAEPPSLKNTIDAIKKRKKMLDEI
jgi:hypothetical protein